MNSKLPKWCLVLNDRQGQDACLAEAAGQPRNFPTRTPPAMDIWSDEVAATIFANTGLRIGSMPEVNAAVTGETASSPRDRQMNARPSNTLSKSPAIWMVYGWFRAQQSEGR